MKKVIPYRLCAPPPPPPPLRPPPPNEPPPRDDEPKLPERLLPDDELEPEREDTLLPLRVEVLEELLLLEVPVLWFLW